MILQPLCIFLNDSKNELYFICILKMRKKGVAGFLNIRGHFVPILEDEYAFLSWSQSASQVPSKQAEARLVWLQPMWRRKG